MAEFGSFQNMIQASATNGQPTPVVGMGITVLMWSDRKPGTITRVSPSGKTFWYKRDEYKRIDTNGMSESQTYEFTPDDTDSERRVSQRKNGQWKETGGSNVALGYRSAYHDFSF